MGLSLNPLNKSCDKLILFKENKYQEERMRRNARTFIILGLIGLILGSIVGKLLGIPFLNKGIAIGLQQPFLLDLSVIKLSFSLAIDVSLCSIIGLVLALFIASRL